MRQQAANIFSVVKLQLSISLLNSYMSPLAPSGSCSAATEALVEGASPRRTHRGMQGLLVGGWIWRIWDRNKMMPSYEIAEGIRLKSNIQELHCLDLHLSVMLCCNVLCIYRHCVITGSCVNCCVRLWWSRMRRSNSKSLPTRWLDRATGWFGATAHWIG